MQEKFLNTLIATKELPKIFYDAINSGIKPPTIIEIIRKHLRPQKLDDLVLFLEKRQSRSSAENLILGFIYEQELAKTHDRNLQRGLAYSKFKELANQGDSYGQFFLAVMYYRDIGSNSNLFPRALELLVNSATQGNSCANFMLGQHFEFGQSGSKFNAFLVYQKAAEIGHILAINSLARFLFLGVGANRDVHKSLKWYRKGVSQKNGESRKKINEIFRR
ncbi:2299_t:CDS:1 [Ambispora gerdemannii]|uniref:2299_t:CDS:1 n=1 Tax=Ambispora gerdemannii TaxID=144530 RepID=A0A9N9FIN5_9GLOM|nr:2299_t:CDS:1 [Ambispora gerdemannii]